MQIRDTGLGFGITTIVLHWIAAALVGGILYIGLTAARMDEGTDKLQLLRIHSSLGVAVFVSAIYRLIERLRTYYPLPLGTVSPIEVIIGRSVAIGLIVATLVLPVIGWFAMSASGATVTFFDLISLPSPIGRNPDVASVAKFFHWLGAYAFMTGLALHVFGAFKHHFILRNDTLKRMLGKHVDL